MLLSIPSVLLFAGCGDAPSNAPPQPELSGEEAEDYEETMRRTGGRG